MDGTSGHWGGHDRHERGQRPLYLAKLTSARPLGRQGQRPLDGGQYQFGLRRPPTATAAKPKLVLGGLL